MKKQKPRFGRSNGIGSVLEEMYKRYGWDEKSLGTRASSAWDVVAGQKLASNTERVFIKSGVLYVVIKSPAIRFNMRGHLDDLLIKINTYLETDSIKEIRLI
ncbi:MAG: DUF721 domain-containing protein [Flavobacteriales bacterium]